MLIAAVAGITNCRPIATEEVVLTSSKAADSIVSKVSHSRAKVVEWIWVGSAGKDFLGILVEGNTLDKTGLYTKLQKLRNTIKDKEEFDARNN